MLDCNGDLVPETGFYIQEDSDQYEIWKPTGRLRR